MVTQDEYPDFPKLECSTCHEKFDIPRGWVNLPGFGKQLIMDWEGAEVLLKYHFQTHVDTLTNEVEEFLRADARSRGA